jgi:hypothetical protein
MKPISTDRGLAEPWDEEEGKEKRRRGGEAERRGRAWPI